MGKNSSVANHNTRQYKALTSPEYTVRGKFSWFQKNRPIAFRDERIENMWAESLNVAPVFNIREGMLIMFRVNNKSLSIFNGTQAIITKIRASELDPSFVESVDVSRLVSKDATDLVNIKRWEKERPVYDKRAGAGKKTLKYSHFMFCPAWAITVHKSQGATLDKVVSNLTRTEMFLPNQGYVVVSRVRSLADLELDNLDLSIFGSDPEVTQFYKLHGLLPAEILDLPEPGDLDVDVQDLCGLSKDGETIRNPDFSRTAECIIKEYGVYAIYDEGVFAVREAELDSGEKTAETTAERIEWASVTDFISPVFVERTDGISALDLAFGRRTFIIRFDPCLKIRRVTVSGYVIKNFPECRVTGKGTLTCGLVEIKSF